MTAVLAADALLSVLAGMGLLILRRSLSTADLLPWLKSCLRFGALVLAVFYVLRPASWMWEATFVDRILLVAAAMAPVAILLISEAALRRHAPAGLKWIAFIGTVLTVFGAALAPRSLTPEYLWVLLVFQLLILLACAVFLWSESTQAEASDRKLIRTFAVLVFLSLPLIAFESAVLRDRGGLHLSALVLLIGVWLLYGRALWINAPARMMRWSGALLVLALIAGMAVSFGHPGIGVLQSSVPVFATLIVASLIALDLARAAGRLEDELLAILTSPKDALTRPMLLETLAGQGVATVPDDFMAEADIPLLQARMRCDPVWTSATTDASSDADDALSDVARRLGASHLVALGTAPLDLIGLNLGPSETNARLTPLLAAVARRFADGGVRG